MASTLEIDHKEMYSIRTAAEATGYSRDHITSLARAKNIVAAQVGRQWYVDLDSLKQYAQVVSLEQQVKQKHLSEDRRHARELAEKISQVKSQRNAVAITEHEKRIKSAVIAMTALFLMAAGTLTFAGESLLLLGNGQLASSKAAPALEQESSVPLVLIGEEALPVNTTFSDGSVEVHSLALPSEAIILLPQLESASSSVFSDEVEVVTNGDGLRVIVPKGRPASEGVQFVTLPVNEISIP